MLRAGVPGAPHSSLLLMTCLQVPKSFRASDGCSISQNYSCTSPLPSLTLRYWVRRLSLRSFVKIAGSRRVQGLGLGRGVSEGVWLFLGQHMLALTLYKLLPFENTIAGLCLAVRSEKPLHTCLSFSLKEQLQGVDSFAFLCSGSSKRP